jgi:nucleoside-diphosphate-sugar epimerase
MPFALSDVLADRHGQNFRLHSQYVNPQMARDVAHVEDLAAGQILALERGAVGRNYILGGENFSVKRLLDTLATVTGLPPARLRVPRALALGVAHLSAFVEGGLSTATRRSLSRRPACRPPA